MGDPKEVRRRPPQGQRVGREVAKAEFAGESAGEAGSVVQFKKVPGRSADNRRNWDVWPVGRSEGWPRLASWPRWQGPRGEGER